MDTYNAVVFRPAEQRRLEREELEAEVERLTNEYNKSLEGQRRRIERLELALIEERARMEAHDCTTGYQAPTEYDREIARKQLLAEGLL